MYCNPGSFPSVGKDVLTWNYRRNLFKDIIRNLNADIFCFEEIDAYEKFKNEVFDDLLNSYSSNYHSKKSGGQGIALFYKKDVFELIHSYQISLMENESTKKISNQFISINFLKVKNQVDATLCLIITHLKAKHENEGIRVCQIKNVCELINEDKEFLELFSNFNCKSLIFCGDFNTEPDSESIQYLKGFQFKNEIINNFKSVYNVDDKTKDDFLECSTFKFRKDEFYRVIDYIFHAGNIKIDSIEKIPNKNSKEWETIKTIGLPSSFFPSDHHYIGFNFEL